ncbi:hypothetical protein [Micromonospora echinofusca]|uniref:hypothetical protein n=1 Tax=Micromonospora echinofusca TaxID=47858 RepID=UPI0033CB10F0
MTAPAPTPGLPQPILTPGAGAAFYDGPAFDPADVVAQLPPRPQTGSGAIAGELREPTQPLAPPQGVEVPEDHAAALAEFDRRDAAWRDAVDAVEDYRDAARLSRAQRATAIREAGRAAAQGSRRPKIPDAISEDAEAVEVAILSSVVDVRRAEATAAAQRADTLAEKYAPTYAAALVERFTPQLAEASAALQAAIEKTTGAEGLLGLIAAWRSLVIAAELKRDGVRVTDHQRARIMSDLLDSAKTQHFRTAEAHHRSPSDLLGQARDALGRLHQCDPHAVPNPDMIYLPGGFAESRAAWLRMWDVAPEATRQRYRDRYNGGRPLRHELSD